MLIRRWYAPLLGILLAEDPVHGVAGEPRSHSRFGYAFADPVNNTDPSGEIVTIADAMSGLNINLSVRFGQVGQRVQSAMNMLKSACNASLNVVSGIQRHHAVPKFLGGKKVWDDEFILRMEQIVHDRLHLLLDLMLKVNGFAGRTDKKFGMSASEYYEKLYRRLPGSKPAVLEIILDVADVFDAVCAGVPGVSGSLKAKVKAVGL